MITVTLHDKDAVAVLSLLQVQRDLDPVPFDRATAAFKCALLLCDCDKVGKEKEG